ncbi:hypothetical protein ACRTAS_000389 [Clostridium perfringens]
MDNSIKYKGKEKRMKFKVYNRNEFEEICKNNDGFFKKLIR